MDCELSEQQKKISMPEKLEMRLWNGTGDKTSTSAVDSTEKEQVGNSQHVGAITRRNTDDSTPLNLPPSSSSSFTSAQHKQQMSHPTNTVKHSNSSAPQVAPHKDMSRTSLSVMDSKTIILSNAPTSTVRHPMHSNTKQIQLQSVHKTVSDSVPTKPPLPSATAAPATTNSTTTTTPSVEKKDSKLVPNGPKQALPLAAPTQNCQGDACKMNGPASNILQLNFPLKNLSTENLNNSRMFATADAALLITSQFVERKREEGSVGGVIGGVAKVLDTTRDLQTTTKIEPLPPQVVDKRTSLPASRRASTGTNGTSYPEIFHSATRRLSETERGLKQALAG